MLLTCQTAMCMCSMGQAPTPLNPLPLTMMMQNLPGATIMDNVPFLNIVPFAMCTSPNNPAVAAALGSPVPCTPAPAGPWVPTQAKVLIQGIPALEMTSQLICSFGGVISILAPGQGSAMTL